MIGEVINYMVTRVLYLAFCIPERCIDWRTASGVKALDENLKKQHGGKCAAGRELCLYSCKTEWRFEEHIAPRVPRCSSLSSETELQIAVDDGGLLGLTAGEEYMPCDETVDGAPGILYIP